MSKQVPTAHLHGLKYDLWELHEAHYCSQLLLIADH